MDLNKLKENLQLFLKQKEAEEESNGNEQSADTQEEDDFNDDYWSEDEFSDVESGEEVVHDNPYNDVSAAVYHNMSVGADDDDKEEEENTYEDLTSEVVKTNEMRKTPPTIPHQVVKPNKMEEMAPTLPPRKDSCPKPPTRHKKLKKPALPEKIHSDKEDNDFYEDLDQMALGSRYTVSPSTNVRATPTKCQQNKTRIRSKEEDCAPQSPRHSRLPSRKMPAIPQMTSNDTTLSNKTSRSPCSVSSRPRIEAPIEKPTKDPLNAFRWYHGDSERMVVQEKLLQHKRDGMFAVRTSTTKGPSYPYAVTLYQDGKTFNFPIRIRDSDKRFALGTEKKDEPSFEEVDRLIDFFRTNKIKLTNNQFAVLGIPLEKSS